MGVNYLWDTNTVIYYLQQQFSDSAEKFMDGIYEANPATLSVITEIELLCWKTPTKEDDDVLHDFLDKALVFELDREIKLKTAEIRKSIKIKLPDAIIAATALERNHTLLSRNIEDFSRVKGLKLINPWDK
jgi:predicted nucleic acid-binding protein